MSTSALTSGSSSARMRYVVVVAPLSLIVVVMSPGATRAGSENAVALWP